VLRAGLLRLGGAMLGEALSADPGHRGPRADRGHGHEAVFAGYREKVIDTVLGPVALRRAWYHCADCGHGLAPRDDELGVAGHVDVARPGRDERPGRRGRAVRGSRGAAGEAGWGPAHRQARRAGALAASGTALAAAGRERARLIASRKVVPLPLPDKLYAAIDGTGVPMTAKEIAGREGKGEDGRARTREVKLAVFFTQDKLDADGTPSATGPPRASSRPSSPPRRSGTWSGPRASAAARTASASSPSSATAPPGSGTSPPRSSPRPPRSSTSTTPASTCTPSPGPWSSCSATEGTNGSPPASKTSTTATSTASRPPSANTPLEGIKKDEVGKELGYFLNNAPRMRYRWFRSRGPFVGSGVVEASCKTIVGQRLKQAGMHWTVAGADAIITLRCKEASSQREAICNHRHNQTGAA
jgi:hypothetical protein